ncbi:MAG: hypothetical protein ACOZQL_15595 [Myxococcota bacterium]
MHRCVAAVVVCLSSVSLAQDGGKVFDTSARSPGFASSILPAPAGWDGGVFVANYSFPTSAPDMSTQPWMTLDPRKQSERQAYYDAVRDYALTMFQGDIKNGCVATSPAWFHAPWMTFSFGTSIEELEAGDIGAGREPLCGLTEERAAPVGFLHKNQLRRVQNWAVGAFNSTGGVTFGKVFKLDGSVDLAHTKFMAGAFVAKFLFTEATEAEVPYLKGAPTWAANVYASADDKTKRVTRSMRLAQIDFGVRDPRMEAQSGWVYGTFLYFADEASPQSDWKKNLVAVGSMWGNDPGVLDPKLYKEQVINPVVLKLRDDGKLFDLSKRKEFGWKDRMNGPIDNPVSSCLSCHGTAQVHQDKSIKHFITPTLKSPATDDQRMWWFTNVKAGGTFTFTPQQLARVNQGAPSTQRATWDAALMKGFVSADYSLQLRMGIENAREFALDQAVEKVLRTSVPGLIDGQRVRDRRRDGEKERKRLEREGAAPL